MINAAGFVAVTVAVVDIAMVVAVVVIVVSAVSPLAVDSCLLPCAFVSNAVVVVPEDLRCCACCWPSCQPIMISSEFMIDSRVRARVNLNCFCF